MKKRLILLFSLPVLAVLLTLTLGEYDYSSAEYGTEFNVNDSTLVKYVGTDTEVVIPEGITCIGQEAFADNGLIVSVSIPSTVERIEYGAFQNCTSLKQIVLPDSVLEVADSAFYGCTSLRNVQIGAGLESLGSGVFADCYQLSDALISDKNNNFVCDDGVIYNKDKTVLYQYLPGNPDNNYKMPDTVAEIKRYSFWGCRNLTNMLLSSGLDNLEDYSLTNCSSLRSLTVYSPTCSIGLKALEGCISLEQIVVPVSIISIHESAFDLCSEDLLFVCDEGTYGENYAKEHGFSVSAEPRLDTLWTEEEQDIAENNRDKAEEEPANERQSDSLEGVLLDGTVVVSDRAFLIVDGLYVNTGVNPPEEENAFGIDDYAFYNQGELTSYDFIAESPNAVFIGELAFARTGLTEVIIPEGVTHIGYGAFYHCDSLTEVSVPSSVTRVDALAFAHTPWYEAWEEDESVSDFLVVGDGVLIAYKGNSSEVVLPAEVRHIGEYVFEGHSEIESLILPEGMDDLE